MINLSPQQLEVVQFPIGGPLQVLASAGSGKTRVLTERIRFLLENTKKDGVIALTFTNAAAEEMQNRLSEVYGVKERCWISTVHGVAQRIIESYGNTIGLPAELHIYERDLDRKALFIQSLTNASIDVDYFLGSEGAKDRNKKIQRYMEMFSSVKRELLTDDEIQEISTQEDNFWEIYSGYQETLLASGGIDFDDILVYAHRILLEQPWCAGIYRAKYRHVCVDEAQDLNKAQYEFVKALCGDDIRSVLMVGDPNQMIYGFNGSSTKFLCQRFPQEFTPAVFELKLNYRSSRAVIHLANKIKPGSQIETSFALEGRRELVSLRDENSEAEWVVSKIQSLLGEKNNPEIEGDISVDKIVIIGRNWFVFSAIEEALGRSGLSFSRKKGERQAEPSSTLGKVLDLSIRLKLNPKDWIDGKKLCAALKIPAPIDWNNEDILSVFSEVTEKSSVVFNLLQSKALQAINNLNLEKPNFPKLFHELDAYIRSLVPTNSSDDAQAELEQSFFELAELQRCWTAFKRKGLGDSLLSFRNAMALGQLSEAPDNSGISLSTVHTMKGLEKDIVFLVGMCEGVFPDYRAISSQELEEEKNSAFVAITRSRRWIYVTYPEMRKMPWGDLRWHAQSRFFKLLAD